MADGSAAAAGPSAPGSPFSVISAAVGSTVSSAVTTVFLLAFSATQVAMMDVREKGCPGYGLAVGSGHAAPRQAAHTRFATGGNVLGGPLGCRSGLGAAPSSHPRTRTV